MHNIKILSESVFSSDFLAVFALASNKNKIIITHDDNGVGACDCYSQNELESPAVVSVVMHMHKWAG